MSDYMKVGETSAQLRERIWYAFYRDNVSMPFPTRHVLLDRMKVESRESVAKVDYRCVIEGIDVFEPLSTAEREVLLSSNVIRIYAPGEYIVKCGEPGDSMFIIGRGKAEVRMPSKGGPSTVAVLEAGGFFGEMSLFSGEPRSADVVVTEEAEVVEIMKSTFQKLLFENTSLAEAISKKVSERLASLQNYAFTTQQEGTEVKEAGLLERIKRFFNLS
jgi:CRP-like cAMP-binding protein